MRATSLPSTSVPPRRAGTAIRRMLAAAAALLLTGGVVVGLAAPAAADPPEVRLLNLCGAVDFTWSTGTIGGDESWPTTVLRNGAVIDEFVMRDRGGATYVAGDGDIFEIRREGLPERTYAHRVPDGCTGAPELTATAKDECFSLVLTFVNGGDTPVTGLQMLLPGSAPRELDPVGPGSIAQFFDLADGDPFQVRGPVPGGGWATLLSGRYHQPERCTPDAVKVRFTDVCDGVRVDLASTAGGVIRVETIAPGGTGGGALLAPGDTGRIDVVAAPGTVVQVRDAVTGVEFGRHTIGTSTCGSPDPSPTGAEPGGTEPPSPGGGPGTGGGLPVTGVRTALFSVAGLLLLSAGAVLFLLARRRRLRFTTADGR
ncbi:LPXTG cell wall anchor domain-containing protein [Micromonospora peucetia]|uniref:LPXTG cell wall anchor domain-containing protein n=1 Tax=Micromonospora peucetia TaxID=47871 RepID=UPI0022594D53|nr:LPXTG cell wall anchor domain-containing protein [Micromonospora peucetia]MCX4390062.1 LPXTG cell wall anchor domain-containing protein [Micromonospora peucetia]